MEVKKVGEVVVIRLRKKEYRVRQKPCIRRSFFNIRNFFRIFPKEEDVIISGDEVESIILNTFGSDYQYHLLIADERYRLMKKDMLINLLKKDKTDQYQWIEEDWDCDNFAEVLDGNIDELTYPKGYAFGQLWFFTNTFGHAINFAILDTKDIVLIEPQNDEIFTWNDIKNKYPDAKAFMVKI
jgi:hypothetical protein